MVRWIKNFQNRKEQGTLLIFLIFSVFLFARLIQHGSMIDASGDAADIWQTIKTYYSDDVYPSYVLYKGFASVYPYVWFYQLAKFFHLNEFFFVMCYHAVLYGYIVAVGIPKLVEYLIEYKPKFWQKILLGVVLYCLWDRYRALGQLMVDLPSCAYFLMAIQCAISTKQKLGCKKYIMLILTGGLCGIIANISGQYSVSAICILIYAITQVWKKKAEECNNGKRLLHNCICIGILGGMMLGAKGCNIIFNYFIIRPLVAKGAYIADGSFWLQRALFYMMDIGRKFYGPDLHDARGNAIVMSIYGEQGKELLERAAAGGFVWTIPEYFKAFFQYPVDFIMLYLNRVIIMLSDDMGKMSLRSLVPLYTMFYLAICTCVKRLKKVKDVFRAKTWIVLSAFASIIPILVTTVELRVIISVQALCFGVALTGPIIPMMWTYITTTVKQCREQNSLKCIMEKNFPWELIGWVIFCLVCLAYFGALCGNSDLGISLLYKW